MAVSGAMEDGGGPASAALSQHDPSIAWVLASLCDDEIGIECCPSLEAAGVLAGIGDDICMARAVERLRQMGFRGACKEPVFPRVRSNK